MKDWKLPIQFVTNVFTFLEKVVSTRAFIWSIHLNTLFGFCWPLWACLSLLEQFISSINPSGFPFDGIPPQLLKKVFPTLGPFILAIINSTLTFCKNIFGQFSLKKNRPWPFCFVSGAVSRLPFFSKLLQKIAFTQLKSFLGECAILEVFQPGLKTHQSNQYVLLRLF